MEEQEWNNWPHSLTNPLWTPLHKLQQQLSVVEIYKTYGHDPDSQVEKPCQLGSVPNFISAQGYP